VSTTLGYHSIDVLRLGTVAVVESASDSAHYPAFNHRTYDRISIPWLRLKFYDETELDWLLAEPLERRFAAVAFTPGAIALPSVRDAMERQAETLAEALQHGVGLVISATSLGGMERFDLSFLPEGSQVSLVQAGMRSMAGSVRIDDITERQLSEAEGWQALSGVTVAASHAFGWLDAATLRRSDGTVETVAWRAQFGRGRVIVAVLPFERLGWHEVIERMLTRATRSRSCLILGRDSAPAWYEEMADGEALARISYPHGDQKALNQLLDNFAELRLCRDATWDAVGCLTHKALLARLENDGTVEFAADGPNEVIYSRLAGVPQYLLRLRQVQADLIDMVSGMHASPTFHVLAMAILCRTAEHVVQDPLFVPDLLRMETARSMVEGAIAHRVSNGSVDELLLPTVNILAAASITGAAPEAAPPMVTWIKNNAAAAHSDHLAQARWVARAANRLDLLDLMPEPTDQPDSLLGRLSRELDAGNLTPLPLPAGSVVSMLDAAIFAYTYAYWSLPGQASSVWDLLNEVDRSFPEKSFRANRNVEELCYRTAAEVLLDAASPLAVHPTIATQPELIPRRATELLSRQAAVEMDTRKGQQAVEELNKVIGATRTMAGILATMLTLAAIAVISIPFWLPQLSAIGVEAKISISTAAFVVISTPITLASTTKIVQLIAPRWVAAVGGLVRALVRK
jgi:hypothetical protein